MQQKYYKYDIYYDDVHITNILSVESKIIHLIIYFLLLFPNSSYNKSYDFERSKLWDQINDTMGKNLWVQLPLWLCADSKYQYFQIWTSVLTTTVYRDHYKNVWTIELITWN